MTSARRLKLRRSCSLHNFALSPCDVFCSCFQYSGFDYVCYPTYLGLYKIVQALIQLFDSDVYIVIMVTNEIMLSHYSGSVVERRGSLVVSRPLGMPAICFDPRIGNFTFSV